MESILNEYIVFDIETDGLIEQVSKIHCLSYTRIKNNNIIESKNLVNYEEIKNFILKEKVLVGHNIILYDIPILEKILKISIKATLIDTLALSWYLLPKRPKHGLDGYGKDFKTPKPIIKDWINLSQEDYINRCSTDVKINTSLFLHQIKHLNKIYNSDIKGINKIIKYLSFKLDCIREQEEVKTKIDVDSAKKYLNELYKIEESKTSILKNKLPVVIKYKENKRPDKIYKKDGLLTTRAIKWFNLLEERNLPEEYSLVILTIKSKEEGNPNSTLQLKDWLYSLGWVPDVYEDRVDTKGNVNKVPQIYKNGGLTQSVKDLINIEPAIKHLEMLTLVKHRIGVFKGFLESVDKNNFVKASLKGLTNTLRIRHTRPISNLPNIRKFYGKEIRGLIIPHTKKHVVCGSDMSALEDTTKQHYMYFFDPEYVKEMRVPGFDPHIDVATLSGLLTEEEAKLFKELKKKDFLTEEEKKIYGDLSFKRSKAKTINFAGIYGAGPPKIAQSLKIPLNEAIKLHKTYWKRNKAVKLVEKSTVIKTVNDQMWQYNPISKMWYSLRYLKDRFSTLNQGSAVYIFDTWVRGVRKRGIKISIQYHDEIEFSLLRGEEEKVRNILLNSIDELNNSLKLNVPFGISIDFGENYAEVH